MLGILRGIRCLLRGQHAYLEITEPFIIFRVCVECLKRTIDQKETPSHG